MDKTTNNTASHPEHITKTTMILLAC